MQRILVVALVLWGGSVRGQAVDANPANLTRRSLREALDYARAHQPSLAAARARVVAAHASAEVPRAAFSPRVTAAAEASLGTSNNTTASYATLGILDVARIGGTPANAPVSWAPEASTIAGIAIHQEIYDFGRIETQADAYDQLARSEEQAEKVARRDLDLLVEESFYAILGARAIEKASEAAVVRSRAHRDLARARVTAQLWPPIEMTRAEADLSRFELDRVRAQGALATAQAVFAAALGSDEPAVDAGVDDVTFAAPEGAAEVSRAASAHAPELAGARARLSAQQRFTAAIRAELRPDLALSAELTSRAGGADVSTNPTPSGNGLIPSVPNYDALLVLSWPMFDRVVDARARVSKNVERLRATEIDQIAQQIQTLAARSYIAFQVAGAALPALQHALDAAEANHAQAEARFNGGLGTAIEVSDAEALLTAAQIQLAIGQFELSRARVRLARLLP